MRAISFKINIVPPKSTSQSGGKRIAIINGKPMFFRNKAQAQATDDYLFLCSQHAPSEPIRGPVKLSLVFVWPYRKTEKKRRIGKTLRHTSKPDADNAAKALVDVLTKLRFFEDDSQVFSLSVEKYWAETPGVLVTIEERDVEM